jgi:hypothetical protein
MAWREDPERPERLSGRSRRCARDAEQASISADTGSGLGLREPGMDSFLDFFNPSRLICARNPHDIWHHRPAHLRKRG